jgi:two-component system, OmpR family, response regulator
VVRLLLVEPHALLARALRMGQDEEGFAIDAVVDQKEADERVCAGKYDVIVLDLPGDHSQETLRRWRLSGLRTPVLLVTEPGRDAERRGEAPMNNFATLNKPFGLEDLLARLRTLAGNNGNQEKFVGL